jgi:SagB-type dehydrogenase family enzyme
VKNGIGEQFMENTKYSSLDASDQLRGLPPPPFELEWDKHLPVIDLPPPSSITVKDLELRLAIEKRSSVRDYTEDSLSLQELSYLLWCTQGVRKVIHRSATLRNVPSAGARHALETYLLVNNIDELIPGLYRFLPSKHGLIQFNDQKGLAERASMACFGQDFIKTSAATFIWTAVLYRMSWRYGERGYRYLHLDAGHVCQNLYLSAQSIDCGVCAIGAL